jgi:hypothetical protein
MIQVEVMARNNFPNKHNCNVCNKLILGYEKYFILAYYNRMPTIRTHRETVCSELCANMNILQNI